MRITDQKLKELETVKMSELDIDYDAQGLSTAKSYWVMGKWNDLTALNIKEYLNSPERHIVALLMAAGHQQLDQLDYTKKFIHLAKSWGCDNELVAKVLVAGVQNTLAKAHSLNSDQVKSNRFFKESISMLAGYREAETLSGYRAVSELASLGLLPQAAEYLTKNTKDVSSIVSNSKYSEMIKSQIEIINHNITLALKKNQFYQSEVNHEVDFEEKVRKLSLSQLGQDLWVLKKTNYKRNGFFVEFGATDGIQLSNTYLLEREFGWSGICADPNPKYFQALKGNRECITDDSCIADETGRVEEFILADEYGGLASSSLSGMHREKVSSYQKAGHKLQVTTISLDDFLVKNKAPKSIDYLSIDTEGSEYSILANFPFEKWEIFLITIEHNFEEQREKIYKLLTDNGYSRLKVEWDDWYFLEG